MGRSTAYRNERPSYSALSSEPGRSVNKKMHPTFWSDAFSERVDFGRLRDFRLEVFLRGEPDDGVRDCTVLKD